MLIINNNTKNPLVSIVIPAFNEEINLPMTLQDLHDQNFDQEVELIVVDNNSQDRTTEIAESYGARVIVEKQKGTRFAYQSGMSQSKGKIVCVTNADVRLSPDWLSTIIAEYEDPGVVGVGTHIRFHSVPFYINPIWKVIHSIGNLLVWFGFNGGTKTFWGASMSCTKEAFEKVGGINHGSNTNEDMLFTLLLSKHGKTVYTYKTIAMLDGRRYAGNPLTAFKNWFNGVGLNSIIVGITGKSKITEFKDIRKEN